AWISARGRASRPTIERAARAIAERFETRAAGDHVPVHRSVERLRRIGHVEWIPGGLVVVPPTLCWSRQHDRGLILGARDGILRGELHGRLGPQFEVSHPGAPWPETWRMCGEFEGISEGLADLGLDAIQEPGMRILASLPTLEEAIAEWPDDGRPSATVAWEVLTSPDSGQWSPADDPWIKDGLLRSRDRRRGWMIMRYGLGRRLDAPERRAVAWWAELVRQVRPRLDYHRDSERLTLPASLLPPPVMVERPLIWASGGPPRRDRSRRRIYEPIDPERASDVARVLGLRGEVAS
ncbi:MAG: hypothetical protein ACYC61_19320, partial [Isosphaeraceae bacterium]